MQSDNTREQELQELRERALRAPHSTFVKSLRGHDLSQLNKEAREFYDTGRTPWDKTTRVLHDAEAAKLAPKQIKMYPPQSAVDFMTI